MNIDHLNLMELGVLRDSLAEAVFRNPLMSNLVLLRDEVKGIIKADPRYKTGNKLWKKAKANGAEDGHSEPEDWFFCLYEGKLFGSGERLVTLLMCPKYRWWMNGETFNPEKDNMYDRDFGGFIPKGVEDFDPEDITEDVTVVRQWLLDDGYEEKPELGTIYHDFIHARYNQRYGA